MKRRTPGIAILLCVSLLDARQEKVTCGTYPAKLQEELHLHRQSTRRGIQRPAKPSAARLIGEREIAGKSVLPDAGNIAVMDDTGGVVARRNPFNLDKRTLRFVPVGSTSKYRFELSENTYDAAAAQNGRLLASLKDDDSSETALPFEFPFWNQRYKSIFVNSDGNLTFGSGDAAITDRSLGRMNSGQPRIAGLYRDLDPTKAANGIRVTSEANRFVITWAEVPEYQDSGTGRLQTFQIRLHPDGAIEIAYSSVTTQEAISGISPGKLQGETNLVSFGTAQSTEYTSTIAERFAGTEEIDIVSAAQKFYLNHEDAYDYLVIFNSLGVSAGDGSVAYEITFRNNRSGYGDQQVDIGAEAGSRRRLQAIMNMGPLTQYPKDPFAKVQSRLTSGDTPLTVLAHEAGHLFLAFASVRDENDAEARPMLGRQTAHWEFKFNSEASVMEGNRIRDNGPNASPRFLTTASVEGFSALDQYLMGFLSPQNLPDTFLVVNPRATNATGAPRVGVAFDGTRRDIRIDEIIRAEGRRIPDHTVSQRKFRLAFIVVTASGAEPSAADIEQLETYRREFEAFFSKAASGNAVAETSLKRSLRLSTFPAAGVLAGGTATGTVAVEKPAQTPLTVLLRSATGAIGLPPSVTIPVGASEARFTFQGAREGVDDLIAEPGDPQFETVQSRIQVSRAEALSLSVVSGDFQTATPGSQLTTPVSFRVTDRNGLAYPNIPVTFTVAGGGSLDRASAVTDEAGVVSIRWAPGSEPLNEIRASIPGGPAVAATALSRPLFSSASVVNAASFASGLTPGGIATIFGANLSGATPAEVLVNGQRSQVFYSTPRQVNFFLPLTTPAGTADVSVRTASGTSDSIRIPVNPVQPGIFFDAASGFGAVLISGTNLVTQQRPAAAGEIIEIYATGLGPVEPKPNGLSETTAPPQVMIGGVAAQVVFSGLAPGFPGLYQINARVPPVAAGAQTLRLNLGAAASNEVRIQVR